MSKETLHWRVLLESITVYYNRESLLEYLLESTRFSLCASSSNGQNLK